jgi:hypothetical protein
MYQWDDRHVTYEGQENFETKDLKRKHFRNLNKDWRVTLKPSLQKQSEGKDWVSLLRVWLSVRLL